MSPIKMVTVGDMAPDFELFDHTGTKRKLSSFRGRLVLLSFYRFAACPICIYNVDRLNQHIKLLKRVDIVTLSIFKSTPQIISKFSSTIKSGDDSYALSDTKGEVFKKFTVKKSTKAAVNGVVCMVKNYKKKYKQVVDIDVSAVMKDTNGMTNVNQLRQLPADFVINEEGVIVDLYRAENMSDHIPFERVEAFIPEGKRCRCNKRDCIVPRCRDNHEKIMTASAKMIYMGY